MLSTESVLMWHLTEFGRERRRLRAWHGDPSGPPVLLLDSPEALEHWLAGLPPR
ncbi:hypothetical protein GCM10029963_13850 [Micromonospora andamanensis]